jgi:hypothetical protein
MDSHVPDLSDCTKNIRVSESAGCHTLLPEGMHMVRCMMSCRCWFESHKNTVRAPTKRALLFDETTMAELHLLYHNLFSSILFLLGTTAWIMTFLLNLGDPLVGADSDLRRLLPTPDACACGNRNRPSVHSHCDSRSLQWQHVSQYLAIKSLYRRSYMRSCPLPSCWFPRKLCLWCVAGSILFTALLTLFGRSCCVPGAGLDNMANTAYTLGTIGILFSAYEIIFTADGSNQFLGYFAKCGGLILWDVAAALYTAGRDTLKLRQRSSYERLICHCMISHHRSTIKWVRECSAPNEARRVRIFGEPPAVPLPCFWGEGEFRVNEPCLKIV